MPLSVRILRPPVKVQSRQVNLCWKRWLNYFSQVTSAKTWSGRRRPPGSWTWLREHREGTGWQDGVLEVREKSSQQKSNTNTFISRLGHGETSVVLLVFLQSCLAGPTRAGQWSLQMFFSKGLGHELATGKHKACSQRAWFLWNISTCLWCQCYPWYRSKAKAITGRDKGTKAEVDCN